MGIHKTRGYPYHCDSGVSKVPKFTVEEVLARVVLDVEDKTKEVPVRSVDEVVKSSTDQLSCLRESTPNYYDFIGEARKELFNFNMYLS